MAYHTAHIGIAAPLVEFSWALQSFDYVKCFCAALVYGIFSDWGTDKSIFIMMHSTPLFFGQHRDMEPGARFK